MISEIYILFFKASLTIRHTATVSQKKSGTSKKIQWDFQISRVGSLDFLDLKVNGSPAQRRAARWVKNQFSPYESVTNMLSELGWRSLEDRRIDARLIMFYKIVHGYVAIQLPPYFDKPFRYTRHMHTLSFRQIHTAASYYQYSFYPASVVLWNRLPSEVVLLEDLDSFREGVCKINHRSP